jgi:GH24 family phage-related lysozyme (muramidase)
MADPRLRRDVAFAEAPGGRPVLRGYLDTRGVPTAGYGHTGPDVVVGQLYTEQQCEDWLDADLDEATAEAQQLREWDFLDTDCRQNALIECVYNLGVNHWTAPPPHGFPKTRAAMQRQDWPAVSANLLNSPEWIREVHLARVQRLAGYFLNGSYSAAPAS